MFNSNTGGIYIAAKPLIQLITEVQVRISLPTGTLDWVKSIVPGIGDAVWNDPKFDGIVGIAKRLMSCKIL